MNKKILFVFLILIIISGCKNKELIEKEQFINILINIHKCEGYLDFKEMSDNDTLMNICKENAIKLSGVDILKYSNTIKYYINHTDEFEVIYDTIINRLELKKVKYDKIYRMSKGCYARYKRVYSYRKKN